MGSLSSAPGSVTTCLTIAGSDSGGGAGVQADLKVFFAFGCHGTSAITALTAQNTTAVTGVLEVPASFVTAQIEAVVTDMGVDAAKTGMLASADIVAAVAQAIEAHGVPRLVVDPVMVSKSGDRLLAPDAVSALAEQLLPLAAVVTPNLHEAGLLLQQEIRSLDEMHDAARALESMGPANVLVKGGHLEGDAVDVFYDGRRATELRSARLDTTNTHGTGCALAAAVTARLAQGAEPLEAARDAKTFVTGAIRHALRLGRGHGPVNPGWRPSVPVT
jgi:hydroxymethylpyrimidine/phosphomethylpyrimidine kinase